MDFYLCMRYLSLMPFLSDNRSQAIQIGAVLIFGILIVLLASWQAFGVPNQNEEIEFNHNQDVQEEMTDLRDTAVSMPGRTTPQSASVNLGVRYPARVIFVNPGPASGSLRTVGTTDESQEIIIENASAIDEGDHISVDDFWDGSEQTYNTGALEYRPGYNLYQNAPRTIYEHSVLFNEFEREDATLPITDQAIIDNDRITLVALNGSLSENRVGRASVDFKPVSTQTRIVDITDDEEQGNITLHLPTRLSLEEWQSLVSDEDTVTVTESNRFDSGIELEFDSGADYELQLAKVGLGTKVTETEEAYLNGVSGNSDVISDDQSHTLTIEVRDEFNNPKGGVTVTGSAEGGDLKNEERETRNDGKATFEYEPDELGSPGDRETHQLNFSIQYAPDTELSHDSSTPENITMSVTVESAEPVTGRAGQRAFNANWSVTENPRGGETETIVDQPGIKGCDDGVCTYNQTLSFEEGGDAELTLPMHTSPEVDGADADFAVSEEDYATVTSPEQIVGSTAETTFTPEEEETVTVFTWAGGSGDSIDIEIIELTDDPGPTITQFDTDSIDGSGAGNSGIEVDWAVEAGDADLDEVEIEIMDDGTVVEDEVIPVGGQSADGTEEITSPALESGKVYDVRLTVTDADNRSESDTKIQEAG